MFCPQAYLIANIQWLDIPNTVCVLCNHPVCGKESHPGHASDGFDDPFILVFERLVDHFLGCDVGVEVVRDKVVVAVINNGGDQSREVSCIPEGAAADRIEDLGKALIELEPAVEVTMTEVFNVLGQISKQKDVLLADLAGDFNLRSISNDEWSNYA